MKTITLKNAIRNIRAAKYVFVASQTGGGFTISKQKAVQWLEYRIEVRKNWPSITQIYIQPLGKRGDVYLGEPADSHTTRDVI